MLKESKMKKAVVLFLAAMVLCLSSCGKKRTFTLESEDFKSITPDQEWALVTSTYAAFLEECNYTSAVTGHARRGDIFPVTGKEFVKVIPVDENGDIIRRGRNSSIDEFEVWYKFEQGCLSGANLLIFDTKFKAQKAALSQE